MYEAHWATGEVLRDKPVAPVCEYAQAIADLISVGQYFFARGWSLATSSNYSVVVNHQPLRLLITASGKDKGRLTPEDFVVVDERGRPTPPDQPRASAETLLHVVAAKRSGVGAVLHTHSVWATLLSDVFYEQGGIRIEGFEMLKGLAGIDSHQASIFLKIFDNTQDIAALAGEVERWLAAQQSQPCYGYLIRRHGLYTWGRNLDEARRHVEALEFLLECVGQRQRIAGTWVASA